jgi:DNA-binding transcriptional LysR family regulator
MKLKQIETFYWAAQLGSFSRAAKRLNATQSAVSMRIRELEGRLGVSLFDRSQRSVRLTPDGVSILPYAEQLVRTAQEMLATMARKEAISGFVRVGVAEIVAHTWLPQFLELLNTSYPFIRVELEVALSHLTELKLGDGGLDMALTTCELPSSRYINTSLGAIPFRWMASPLLQNVPDRVLPKDLCKLPAILTCKEEKHRGEILHWVVENRIRFESLTVCNTFVTAAAMAKAGLGLALLPTNLYAKDVADGSLRVITCSPDPRPLSVYSLRPREGQTPAHRAVEWAAMTASTFPGKTALDLDAK